MTVFLQRLLTFFLSFSRSGASSLGQSVRVKLDENTIARKRSNDLLVPEAVIPAGAVIEVQIESYKKASPMPSANSRHSRSLSKRLKDILLDVSVTVVALVVKFPAIL